MGSFFSWPVSRQQASVSAFHDRGRIFQRDELKQKKNKKKTQAGESFTVGGNCNLRGALIGCHYQTQQVGLCNTRGVSQFGTSVCVSVFIWFTYKELFWMLKC